MGSHWGVLIWHWNSGQTMAGRWRWSLYWEVLGNRGLAFDWWKSRPTNIPLTRQNWGSQWKSQNPPSNHGTTVADGANCLLWDAVKSWVTIRKFAPSFHPANSTWSVYHVVQIEAAKIFSGFILCLRAKTLSGTSAACAHNFWTFLVGPTRDFMSFQI